MMITDITQEHVYWCEGCDRVYEGEPNSGFIFDSGIRDDEGRQIHSTKVLIGEPVKYCHQDDDDVCVLEDGSNWHMVQCKGFECGKCHKEFWYDDNGCYEHPYSGEATARHDAEACCGGDVTPPEPAPSTTAASSNTIHIRYEVGTKAEVTMSRAEGTPWSAGQIITITACSTDANSEGYILSGTGDGTGDTHRWNIYSSHVKPAKVDETLNDKLTRKEAPTKKPVVLDI